jgi:hypothetical protein
LNLVAARDDTAIAASDIPMYVNPETSLDLKLRTISYLASLKRSVEVLKNHDDSPAKRVRLNSTTTSLKPNDARTAPASMHSPDVIRVQGEISFLSRSAMSESRHDFSQFPQQLRTENIVKIVAWSDEGDALHGAPFDHVMRKASTILLDERRAGPQMQAFLENARGQLFQLQVQDMMGAYDSIIDEQKLNHKPAQSELPTSDHFKVYMGIVIGSLYSNQSHRTAAYAEQMLDAAMSIFEDVVRNYSSIVVVDCMLYLIMYSTLRMSAESTWHLIALAMRLSTSAGLHKEPEGEHGLSQYDLLFTRNLFWSLFCFDRCVSAVSCFRSGKLTSSQIFWVTYGSTL